VSVTAAASPDEQRQLDVNRRFYEDLWRDSHLVTAERFNTWPLVQELVAQTRERLEVAPGLRPRLPIAGTHFVDISRQAAERLRQHGGAATLGSVTDLPFPAGRFDLVCALDIVEHVDDDDRALAELVRVATPDAVFLLSIPLHPSRWSKFDEFVGHRRRYEPARLFALLAKHGLVAERTTEYAMQPKSSRLLDFGMWFLIHRRARAIWWYNNVFMPIGLRFDRKLAFTEGMVDVERADEILMVCRRKQEGGRHGDADVLHHSSNEIR
jgi:SAM-dependent methyltransferase